MTNTIIDILVHNVCGANLTPHVKTITQAALAVLYSRTSYFEGIDFWGLEIEQLAVECHCITFRGNFPVTAAAI